MKGCWRAHVCWRSLQVWWPQTSEHHIWESGGVWEDVVQNSTLGRHLSQVYQEVLPYLAHNQLQEYIWWSWVSMLNMLQHFKEGLHVVSKKWSPSGKSFIWPDHQTGPDERLKTSGGSQDGAGDDGKTSPAVTAIHACMCRSEYGNTRAHSDKVQHNGEEQGF